VWSSLRPRQWIKNLFIFAGILFSQNLLHGNLLIRTVLAFFVFCLLSGSVYILNDCVDREKDRRHPSKSQRPIAAGRLSRSHAALALVVSMAVGLAAAYTIGLSFFGVAAAYVLLQLSYTLLLKDVVILDVLAVACGFVLRVVAGGVVIDVDLSHWLLLCSILLALFLALSKRRHESVALEGDAPVHRSVLGEYNPYLLDQMISVVTASTVIAYALYTISAETIEKFGTKNLLFTIPFVLYGIFRYLYLVHRREAGGNPESIVISDRPLMLDILLWIGVAAIILYT
jgi:4-hydroxybenzoate polyprenyltransferase